MDLFFFSSHYTIIPMMENKIIKIILIGDNLFLHYFHFNISVTMFIALKDLLTEYVNSNAKCDVII